MQSLRGWERKIEANAKQKPVSAAVRAQWTKPGERTSPESIARLLEANRQHPESLATATELASRYLELNLNKDAEAVLQAAVRRYDAKKIARGENAAQSRLLGQAYFQLSRAVAADAKRRVEYATLSFFLNPSIGYGKQIARIIAPEKFDRPDGRFDNRFREGTLRRLRKERSAWLKE